MRKVIADVGRCRYVGDLLKENALTVVMKICPEDLIAEVRRYFMENGISVTEFWRHLKSEGIHRNGVTKRHKLKHRVSIL